MLKNLEELKTYPFVIGVLEGKITKTKLKLFISNINEFLKDEGFRNKFGFEKNQYTVSDCTMLIRRLILDDSYKLLTGVEAFANYVATKWPQVNENGEILYCFAGSLAVMLLGQADSITSIDVSYFPKIVPYQEIQIPNNFRLVLLHFTRKIGDLDFITSQIYGEMLKKANAYCPDDKEAYSLLRNRILTKGGGGLSINELPELARSCFRLVKIRFLLCVIRLNITVSCWLKF